MPKKRKQKNKSFSPLWLGIALLVLTASMFLYMNMRYSNCTLPSYSYRYTGQTFAGFSGDDILIDRSFLPPDAYENPPFPKFTNAKNVEIYNTQCEKITTDKLKIGSKIWLGFDEDESVDYNDGTRDSIPIKVIQIEK